MIIRKLGKDSLIYGGGDVVGKLIALGTFPVIAAKLSPKAFGALEIINTFIAFSGMFINAGLNNALQRYYWDSNYSEAKTVMVSTGFLTLTIIGIVYFFILILSGSVIINTAKFLNMSFSWSLLIMALSVAVLSQLVQYVQDVTRLHFSPKNFLAISFLSKVLTAAGALFFVVYLEKNISGFLLSQVLVLVTVLPFALLLIKKDLKLKFCVRTSKELISFGYPFIFAGFAYYLFSTIDRWMLAKMSSIEEVGIYSVAFKFSTLILFVSSAIGQAWSPYAMKIKTDFPDKFQKFYSDFLILLLFFMLVVGGAVALFSGEIIGSFMDADYYSSSTCLVILSFSVIFQATTQVTAVGISIEKKSFLLSRLVWVTAILNIALNYLLIPKYGSVGASIATAVSYLILSSIYLFYTQKLLPLPIDWITLVMMAFLGVSVLLISFYFQSFTISPYTILIKLSVASVCILAIWSRLPWKSIKEFR